MRLEKVEIVGFKSFCDRQELDFKGGVTGIVGPNGCGKSNISDAISWVLGEQSAKSLRGTSMEDVIFAGSAARQPVGMAEVNLRISGLNGGSPDGRPECVVTRRLYRDGTSEYLMNGEVCRLRDIHELFMDTGLGSKAYSIIEQGKIGQILSSKPADRRALIEEAAGITKYKARRRQTQLKLEAAQANLLRVNDIVHEVEKQLESLKRQAGKARRYRAVREEMRDVERVLFGRRQLELDEQLRSLDARFQVEAAREQAASLALDTEEAQLEARRTALYDEDARLAASRARLGELTLSVDRHQGRCGYCREQIQDAGSRLAQGEQEGAELRSRVEPLEAALDAAREEESRLAAAVHAAEAGFSAAEATLAAAARQQLQLEQEQEQCRDAQIAAMSRLAALSNARESVSGSAERAASDLLKLAAETQELERERGRIASQRTAAEARRAQCEGLLAELGRERAQAAARVEAARGRAHALEARAEALQSESDSLQGRRLSLQELVASHSAFDEGVRAVLQRPEGLEVMGVVADCVEADKAHERAVEALLGDRLQAVLVPDAATSLRGVEYLRRSEAGRATFLPLAGARGELEQGGLRQIQRAEPRVRALLSDLYRVTGPHAAEIKAALPDALVLETLEDALDVHSRQRAALYVTLSGETIRGALVDGGRAVKGLLSPRREIREVEERLQQIEGLLAEARAGEADELRAAEAAASQARQLEQRIHGVEKELVAVGHDLGVAGDELARLERKAAVLDSERRQAESERGEAAVRLAEIEQALATAEQERLAGSERLALLAGTVARARAEAESAQAGSAEARSQLAALRERASAAAAEARRLEKDQEELLGRIIAVVQRGDELVARRAELEQERLATERLLAQALAERDRAVADTARVEDGVRDIRNELDAREHALKERRRERETLRETLAELEVQKARAGSDLDHVGRECVQALGVSAADAAASLSDEERACELAALEARLQELRDKLERMGPVNVLAVEQAQELDERLSFLTAQRQDLVDSIAEMERAIKGIDRASKQRFQEAFQVINQHFGEIFKQLFGGGTAGLSLLDEEDLLESGIDVMAQPPGKRLQSVLLLSGGEKALTAIALLFAIFQYKPSPFCILDEVDAPLDDANIGRFVRMLAGLKDQTQFVLITHSRRTMEIADQLYGVTMEEPGVSKLVSVRLS
jgi:chromosome segregation protein